MIHEQLKFEPDEKGGATGKKYPIVEHYQNLADQNRERGDEEVAELIEKHGKRLENLMDQSRALSQERYDKQQRGEL